MKGHIIRALFISILISSCTAGVIYAEEPDQEITDDMEYTITAEEIEEMEKSVSESRADFQSEGKSRLRYISITDPDLKMSYDSGEEVFIYTMPNGADFSMTAPLGGITGEMVTVDARKDSWIVSILKDGDSLIEKPEKFSSVSEALASISDEKVLSADLGEKGSYLFHIRSSTLDRSKKQICDSFGGVRVIKENDPIWINELFPPYGYEVGEAYVNGKQVPVQDGGRLELKRDGRYEVHFYPRTAGLPEWVSCFVRDTEAPGLIFTPALTEDPMRTPVSFRTTEAGTHTRVFLNNVEITLYNLTAVADGDYRIIVSDSTGNENEYEFRIRLEEKAPVTMYLILAGALMVIALLVIISAHRRMRII